MAQKGLKGALCQPHFSLEEFRISCAGTAFVEGTLVEATVLVHPELGHNAIVG